MFCNKQCYICSLQCPHPTPKLKSEIALDCEISDLYNKRVTLVRTVASAIKLRL
jgi:hypothetical protein